MMQNNARATSEKIVEQLLAEGNLNIAKLVLEKLSSELGARKATVYYAGEISNEDKTKIKNTTMKKFPKAQRVEFVEDYSLIGGIKVVFEDYIYEESIRKRLSPVKDHYGR